MRTKRLSRKTASISLLNFLIFLLVIPGQLGCSNNKCELDLEHAPDVRGFRLGTSLDTIRSRFPDLPDIIPNQLGLTRIVIENGPMREGAERQSPPQSNTAVAFVDTSRYPEFSGARRTRVDLVDNHVASIEAVYTDAAKWKSLEEFLKSVAEELKVKGVWKKTGEDHEYMQARSIACNNFIVVAGFRVDPADFVSDKSATQKVPFLKLTNVPLSLQLQMRQEEEQQKKSSQP